MSSKFFKLFVWVVGTFVAIAQNPDPLAAEDRYAQIQWVDSVYNTLSLREKIGQLMIIRANSQEEEPGYQKVLELVKGGVGGVCFFKGHPSEQLSTTNALQSVSKVPLLVSIDGEWGMSMRLDSTFAYPWNMTLGAIKNSALIEEVGYRIGKHARRLGVHLNFAPVVDINTNSQNPIIGSRSFGEDKVNVSEKALAFSRGMRRAKVIGTAKHFPGHGDTNKDSHKTLPEVNFNKERLLGQEVFPYKGLIKDGMEGIMIGHLRVPSFDIRMGYPSSLSEPIITEMLKYNMGFEGLICTDGMEMKGVADFMLPGDLELEAFLAGNDLILLPQDPQKAIDKIEGAYQEKHFTEKRLEYSVKKVLRAKYKVGLNHYEPASKDQLISDLNTTEDYALYEKLMEEAITLIKNKDQLLPIKDLDKHRVAYVNLGTTEGSPFLSMMRNYTEVVEIHKAALEKDLKAAVAPYSLVVVGLHFPNTFPWKGNTIAEEDLNRINALASEKKVILNLFASPYALLGVDTSKLEGVVVGYQNSVSAQEKSAQLMFGALSYKGVLPVTLNDMPFGLGLATDSLKRLGFCNPELAGVSSKKLERIDSIMNYYVNEKMMPGAQVLIARKGRVVYNKAFGKQDGETTPVVPETLYDLASLTKILATLPEIMVLEESGTVGLSTQLGEILPELKNTNKAELNLQDVLSHCAGLASFIKIYDKTLDKSSKPSSKYYSKTPTSKFSVKVSQDLYLRKDYLDTITKTIVDSELLKDRHYKYSDLGFMLLAKSIESMRGNRLDSLVQKDFYRPLGMTHTAFNPLNKFPKSQIAPSEKDSYFRNQTIQGYVHDERSAMLGGVAGHAGLFSNSLDVAKLMQMYLQEGFYGGREYLKPETLKKFNKRYFADDGNRRGLGFDKPQLISGESVTYDSASASSFGHSGFTGTYAWADPEEELVYVFLSNRTYPKRELGDCFVKENVRTIVQSLAYKAIVDNNMRPSK